MHMQMIGSIVGALGGAAVGAGIGARAGVFTGPTLTGMGIGAAVGAVVGGIGGPVPAASIKIFLSKELQTIVKAKYVLWKKQQGTEENNSYINICRLL